MKNYVKIGMTGLVVLLVLTLVSTAVLAYQEAPMLSKKVAKGELPPVDERLPEEPLVVEPVERVGDYGGTWKYLIWDQKRTNLMAVWPLVGLVRWNSELDIVPDLAKRFETSEDGSEFTFYLRKGLKWSDGEDFNADDIMFWYEDITANDTITPSKPGWMMVNAKLGKVEKIDDYTVKFIFDDTHSMFLYEMARNRFPFAPEHYLKQFHIDYADKDKLDKMVKESAFETWYDLFDAKNEFYWYKNPDLPTMNPWVPTTEPPAERFVFKRNPYFFKVDTAGNQLPYIDEVVNKVVSDKEVLNMQSIAGIPDAQFVKLSPDNYTLFMENREKGNYEVLLWPTDNTAEPVIYPNLNYKDDDVLAEIINKNEFRQALSLAINRELINQVVYKGLGTPMQATVMPQSVLYKEKYGNAYADYDPKRANELLDSIGLTERDSEGYRLRPDGKRLEITCINRGNPAYVDVMEMVTEDWKEIGVKLNQKTLDLTLFRMRTYSGKSAMGISGFNFRPSHPTSLVPLDTDTGWAPIYGMWYWGGEEGKEVGSGDTTMKISGEKPPTGIKQLMDWWDQIVATADTDKQNELFHKILNHHAENVYAIGTVGQLPQPLIKKNYFRNVPEKRLYSWYYGCHIATAEVVQFFIEKDAQ